MKTRNEPKLVLFSFSAIALVFLIAFLVFSQMKVGIGFGMESKTIIKGVDEDRIKTLARTKILASRELKVYQNHDKHYLIHASENDDNRNIVTDLIQELGSFELVQSSHFGSSTRLLNHEGFLIVYFIVFFTVLMVFFTYRYGYVGFLVAISQISMILVALFINNLRTYPFTKSLWFGTILAIVLLIYQMEKLLYDYQGQSLFAILDSGLSIFNITFFHTLYFSFVAFLSFFLKTDTFYHLSIYLLILSGLNLIFHFLLRYIVLPLLYRLFIDYRDSEYFMIKQYHLNILSRNSIAKGLVIFKLFSILLFFSSLCFIPGKIDRKAVEKGSFFIVSDTRRETILEVPAFMLNEGLIENDLIYEQALEGDYWFSFPSDLTSKELDLISLFLKDNYGVESHFYIIKSAYYPFDSLGIVFRLILHFIYGLLAYSILTKKDNLGPLFIKMVFSSYFFVYYNINAASVLREDIIFLLWMLPIFTTSISLFLNGVKDRSNVNLWAYNFSVLTFYIFLIVFLPILIIIPTHLTLSMIKLISSFLFSLFLSFIIGNPYEKVG